jgi:hypothetical protein
MDWKEIGKSVASIAPTISTALLGAGPFGMIAGGAIKVLTSFLGLGEDSKPEDVVAKINALTPDRYVELNKADLEFKKSLADAGVRLEEIAAGDRDSARRMQVALRSFTPDILSYVLTVGFFGMLWLMYSKAPPTESKDLLNIMLGALGAAWTTSMAFYFGSSTGSDKLKDILAAGGGK